MTVVSAVSTRARHARRAGSNPVGHSMRRWWNGRHARLRPAWSGRAVRVRISPCAQWKAGRVARHPVANRRLGRESHGRSIRSPSALENEPARARAPLGKRLAPKGERFDFSVLRLWMVKLPRRSPRLEPGWARKVWGALPPPSATEGAPPARQRALNTHGQPKAVEDRHFHLPQGQRPSR